MATKRERRDRLREEREAAEQAAASAAKRRLYLGYAVAGVIVVAIVAGIVVAITGGADDTGVEGEEVPENAHVQLQSGSVNGFEFDDREGTPPPPIEQGDLRSAADEAGCTLDLDLRNEGQTHFGPNDDPPEYGTNPPTSGDHIDPPLQQADGAYAEKPDDKYVVHSLEHGRIAIQYSPELSEAEQLELKGVFDEAPEGVLLFPNPDMPYEVAATAWTQLMGCQRYDGVATLDALRAFRDTYLDQGPERVGIYLGG